MTTTTPTSFAIGSWDFRTTHTVSVSILNFETVLNHSVYEAWIQPLATVERVPAQSFFPARPTKANCLG
jgi:hypothetical protein